MEVGMFCSLLLNSGVRNISIYMFVVMTNTYKLSEKETDFFLRITDTVSIDLFRFTHFQWYKYKDKIIVLSKTSLTFIDNMKKHKLMNCNILIIILKYPPNSHYYTLDEFCACT